MALAHSLSKKAQHESEKDLRALLDAISESVLLIKRDGTVMIANPTVAKRLGTTVEELVGENAYDFVAPDVAWLRQKQVQQVIETGLPAQFEDQRDGRRIVNSLTPIFDESGHVDRLAIFGYDITDQMRAEEIAKATLQEKETLLREVHHRVKNNLQAIIYLMDMQASQVRDRKTRQFLYELEGQARTMSLVYEQLYQSENLSRVAMAPYLERLATGILEALGRGRDIDLRVKVAPVFMDVAQAMPCGLIVNELVTNTIKYAFPPDFHGRPAIRIGLQLAGQKYVLIVGDNGVGMPADFDHQASPTLGLRLVNLWATHQLGGSLRLKGGPGTLYELKFGAGKEG